MIRVPDDSFHGPEMQFVSYWLSLTCAGFKKDETIFGAVDRRGALLGIVLFTVE
jgi:hypothetical protein